VPRVYLDYNCFQRGFDDLRQPRIRHEAETCQQLFALAESHKIELVWSFMHDDETALCPFRTRRHEALRLAKLCRIRVAPQGAIRLQALDFQLQAHLSAKDAVHLACAVFVQAEAFLTCDDSFRKRAARLKLALRLANPFDYLP
jgi:hypothetical protein